MDIFISIIIGLGITIIVWLAPIFTGIFGGLMWLPYCFLGGIIPFTGTVSNLRGPAAWENSATKA